MIDDSQLATLVASFKHEVRFNPHASPQLAAASSQTAKILCKECPFEAFLYVAKHLDSLLSPGIDQVKARIEECLIWLLRGLAPYLEWAPYFYVPVPQGLMDREACLAWAQASCARFPKPK